MATLRVLGFTRGSKQGALSEIALLTAVEFPSGCSWAADSRGCSCVLQTESYEFPLVIFPEPTLAAIVTASAAACSAWVVYRGVAKLDLLSTLKEAG